jgi:hypothetical protein
VQFRCFCITGPEPADLFVLLVELPPHLFVDFSNALSGLVVGFADGLLQPGVVLPQRNELLLLLGGLLHLHLEVAVQSFHLQTDQSELVLVVFELAVVAAAHPNLPLQPMVLAADVLHPVLENGGFLQLGLEDLVESLDFTR